MFPSGYRNRDQLNRVQQFDNQPTLPSQGGLGNLGDVVVTSPSDGDLIIYDAGDSRWENRALLPADIPDLDASKIVSGILNPDRLGSSGGSGKVLGYSGWLDFATGEGWVGVIAKLASNTTFTPTDDTSWFPIAFDTNVRITVGAMHNTATYPERFVADVDGVYYFAWMADLTAATNSKQLIGVRKNGLTILWTSEDYFPVQADYRFSGLALCVELSAGEYLELVQKNEDAVNYGDGLPLAADSAAMFFRITTGALVTGNSNLDSLTDVTITSPATGQTLVYDGTSFVNVLLDLDRLADVQITSPTSGQYLVYDGTNWVNSAAGGGPTPTFDSLSNVNTAGKTTGSVPQWNGAAWAMKTYTMADFIGGGGSPVSGQAPVWNGSQWTYGYPTAGRPHYGCQVVYNSLAGPDYGVGAHIINTLNTKMSGPAGYWSSGAPSRFLTDRAGYWRFKVNWSYCIFSTNNAANGCRVAGHCRVNGSYVPGNVLALDCTGPTTGGFSLQEYEYVHYASAAGEYVEPRLTVYSRTNINYIRVPLCITWEWIGT